MLSLTGRFAAPTACRARAGWQEGGGVSWGFRSGPVRSAPHGTPGQAGLVAGRIFYAWLSLLSGWSRNQVTYVDLQTNDVHCIKKHVSAVMRAFATRNQRPTRASSPPWTTYYEAVRRHSIGRPAPGCEYSDQTLCGQDCSAKGLAHGSAAKVATCNCHISEYKYRARSALPLHERCL
jgi:hypothetical protein